MLKDWEFWVHVLSLWIICVDVRSKTQISDSTTSIFLKEIYSDPEDLKELDWDEQGNC